MNKIWLQLQHENERAVENFPVPFWTAFYLTSQFHKIIGLALSILASSCSMAASELLARQSGGPAVFAAFIVSTSLLQHSRGHADSL